MLEHRLNIKGKTYLLGTFHICLKHSRSEEILSKYDHHTKIVGNFQISRPHNLQTLKKLFIFKYIFNSLFENYH